MLQTWPGMRIVLWEGQEVKVGQANHDLIPFIENNTLPPDFPTQCRLTRFFMERNLSDHVVFSVDHGPAEVSLGIQWMHAAGHVPVSLSGKCLCNSCLSSLEKWKPSFALRSFIFARESMDSKKLCLCP
jgi:hypothetical protein